MVKFANLNQIQFPLCRSIAVIQAPIAQTFFHVFPNGQVATAQSFIFIYLVCLFITDGLIGLGILGGTALVVGGAAALVGLVFAGRK